MITNRIIFSFPARKSGIMSKIAMSLLRANCQIVKQQEKKIEGLHCWVFEIISEKNITDEMLLHFKKTIPGVIHVLKDDQNTIKKINKKHKVDKLKPQTEKPQRTYRGHVINDVKPKIKSNDKSKRTYRGHVINDVKPKIESNNKSKRTYRGHIIEEDE